MKNLFFIVCAFLCTYTNAQLSIVNVNTNYIIDFENTVDGVNNGSYNSSGFSSDPSDGQLDSDGIIILGCSDGDMNFGEEQLGSDFARGTSDGGVGTGGVYSFNVGDGNYMLGIQPTTGDLTEGNIILKISNNTGNSIAELSLQYDIWCYNDQGRGNNLCFSYSLDNLNYVSIPELDYKSVTNVEDEIGWIKNTKSITIDIQIPNSESAYLKWTSNDVDGEGSRDELAIDNIKIMAGSAGSNTLVKDEGVHDVFIAPNPFYNQLTIQSTEEIRKVDVYDVTGKLIKSRCNMFCKKVVIPTADLKLGMYIIKVEEIDGHIITRKCNKVF